REILQSNPQKVRAALPIRRQHRVLVGREAPETRGEKAPRGLGIAALELVLRELRVENGVVQPGSARPRGAVDPERRGPRAQGAQLARGAAPRIRRETPAPKELVDGSGIDGSVLEGGAD